MRRHARGITEVRHRPVVTYPVWKAVDDAAAKAARRRTSPIPHHHGAQAATARRGRLGDRVGDDARWGRHRPVDDVVVGGREGRHRSGRGRG
ncbi:hypothetical protein PAHAL_1G104100 [Panicum hallii]|uniref:Uncharacterized protein n=1 Tax=Panicum hallii TaxID=206008 RepID=A0A2T8KUR1_9POAL|nr:hypothetical protein PAHAL_1G104100 [Panicum hallii]